MGERWSTLWVVFPSDGEEVRVSGVSLGADPNTALIPADSDNPHGKAVPLQPQTARTGEKYTRWDGAEEEPVAGAARFNCLQYASTESGVVYDVIIDNHVWQVIIPTDAAAAPSVDFTTLVAADSGAAAPAGAPTAITDATARAEIAALTAEVRKHRQLPDPSALTDGKIVESKNQAWVVADAPSGGGPQRTREQVIDLLVGDTGGDVDFSRDGSGSSSDLRGALRAGSVGSAEIAAGAVTSAKLASGVVPVPASAAPRPEGTAAAGASAKYAREDHVHPKRAIVDADIPSSIARDSELPAANRLIPAGGAANQHLAKSSAADYAVRWVNPPTPGGGGLTSVDPTDLDGVSSTRQADRGKHVAIASGNQAEFELVEPPAPPVPASAKPLVEGAAAVGTSAKYAREDHVHPKRAIMDADLPASIARDSELGPQAPTITNADRGKIVAVKSGANSLEYVAKPSGGGGLTSVAVTDLDGVASASSGDRGKQVRVKSDDQTDFELVARDPVLYTGSGEPVNGRPSGSQGGDYYLRTSDNKLYRQASDGAWGQPIATLGGGGGGAAPTLANVTSALGLAAAATANRGKLIQRKAGADDGYEYVDAVASGAVGFTQVGTTLSFDASGDNDNPGSATSGNIWDDLDDLVWIQTAARGRTTDAFETRSVLVKKTDLAVGAGIKLQVGGAAGRELTIVRTSSSAQTVTISGNTGTVQVKALGFYKLVGAKGDPGSGGGGVYVTFGGSAPSDPSDGDIWMNWLSGEERLKFQQWSNGKWSNGGELPTAHRFLLGRLDATAGKFLTIKGSGNNRSLEWVDAPSGGGGGAVWIKPTSTADRASSSSSSSLYNVFKSNYNIATSLTAPGTPSDGDLFVAYVASSGNAAVNVYLLAWNRGKLIQVSFNQQVSISRWNEAAGAGTRGEDTPPPGSGIAPWTADAAYPNNALALHDGRIWRSLQDANTGNEPAAALNTLNAWWQPTDHRDATTIDSALGAAPGADSSITSWLSDLRNGNNIIPGDIGRPAGHELPDVEQFDYDADETRLPMAVLTPLTFDPWPEHVHLEIKASVSSAGIAPDLVLDLRDSNGNIVSSRATVETDGQYRYHRLQIIDPTTDPGAVSVTLEAVVTDIGVQGGSGTYSLDFRDVLGFKGTSTAARLIATIAEHIIAPPQEEDPDMGITQAEAIALINQLVPPAQRVPALAGHGGALPRVSDDASALHLVQPETIADDVTAEWAQPGKPQPAGSGTTPLVARAYGGTLNFGWGSSGAIDRSRNGSIAEQHAEDIVRAYLSGHYSDSQFSGSLRILKSVTRVDLPDAYYYALINNALTPTSDGTTAATSNLFDFIGEGARSFYSSTETNERIGHESDGDHTLTYPTRNIGNMPQAHGTEELIVIINHPDWTITPASFTAPMLIAVNEGVDHDVWAGYTALRFDRRSAGRYAVTPTGPNGAAAQSLRLGNLWGQAEWDFNLNAGSHPNQVAVNGEVGFAIPYYANSRVDVEVLLDLAITARS